MPENFTPWYLRWNVSHVIRAMLSPSGIFWILMISSGACATVFCLVGITPWQLVRAPSLPVRTA
jgi:hypothetical protein